MCYRYCDVFQKWVQGKSGYSLDRAAQWCMKPKSIPRLKISICRLYIDSHRADTIPTMSSCSISAGLFKTSLLWSLDQSVQGTLTEQLTLESTKKSHSLWSSKRHRYLLLINSQWRGFAESKVPQMMTHLFFSLSFLFNPFLFFPFLNFSLLRSSSPNQKSLAHPPSHPLPNPS